MNTEKHFVFDFDSTFVQVEALEELAAISLKNHRQRDKRMKEIGRLTHLGVDGKIPFNESLDKRVALLEGQLVHIDALVKVLKRKVSVSIKRNKAFFKDNASNIWVISAGFQEFIQPIVKEYGIRPEQVLANTFTYSRDGKITGVDHNNLLSRHNGKRDQLKALKLKGEVYVIGDSYSDYIMKTGGINARFVAFTENIKREGITEKADQVAPSFDEFLFTRGMPRAISYPKNRIKALLLENIHPDAAQAFRDEGYEVETAKGSLNEKELAEKLKDVSILGIRSKTNVTEKALKNAPKLIAVGAFCIGTNQIDLQAAVRRGVCVFNAPYSNTRSVVELVIGEIIMLMRGIPGQDRLMHQGVWKKSADGSFELRGKKLGIVGYGKIGSQLSVLAEGLGMHVYFYDRLDKLSLGNAVRCHSLTELLKKSDVVTLHVDGDPSNTNLIGEKELKAMNNGSYLINLSRGHVVDVEALARALRSGKLAGGAVDVYPYEPKGNDEPFENVLRGCPNLILTPHIGGSTEEAQKDIARYVPEKLIHYVNTGSTYGSVNFPNLQLPELRDHHRLIHLHENVPGIMAKINLLLSQNKINIESQFLKTNEEVGYVITDINKQYNETLIRELKKIENTIRFRVLY
jgi:D-3-phosphoglycerate dehydrogenase / 2-oxoglutarate reductase